MKKIILIIIIIIIGVFLYNRNNNTNPTPQIQPAVQDEIAPEGASATDVVLNGSYTVDPAQSRLQWTGSVGAIKSHYGTIDIKSGNILAQEGSVTGDVVFDMTTVSSEAGPGLDNHLKNEDFFEVETYPEATLVVTDISNETLTGNLTIKDAVQPVLIPLSFSEDNGQITAQGSYDLNRADFNIRYGSSRFFSDLGDGAINDIVPLEFEITLIPQDA